MPMYDVDLTKGPILTHMRRIAIPASTGMLFNTLFNVVDTYYAGKLNTDALAGMTLSFPIFFIIIALSSGIGNGTTALSSISIGEKDRETYHFLVKNAVLLGVSVSVILTVFAPFYIPLLFSLSGAEGSAKTQGIEYCLTIFTGAIFFILNAVINAQLSAQGNTKPYRNFLIIGFILNLILDPLFIFGYFKLGTMGVALATVLIQIVGTVYLSLKLFKSPTFEMPAFLKAPFRADTIIQLLKQGIPATLAMLTIALGIFIINYYILIYSDSTTVAAYGAAMRVEQLILLPALGLNIATLTLSGQNYGANLIYRVVETRNTALFIGLCIMIPGAFIVYAISPFLISLLNHSPEVIAQGSYYLRIEVFAFPTYVILNVLIAGLQGIKKPLFGVFIGITRQFVMPVFLFYLFGTLLGFGIRGVWYGIVVNNWIAVLITALYVKYAYSKLKAKI